MTRESGRLPQGGDAKQAPCEASQSGAQRIAQTQSNNPPTSPDGLLKLAERCEQATGTDRVIDYEIRHALKGGEPHQKIISVSPAGPHSGYETVHYEGGGISQGSQPSRYTASLDAAMTLVPEPRIDGEHVTIGLWTGNGVHAEHVRATAWVSGSDRVFAATAPLALCAAALRARASQ